MKRTPIARQSARRRAHNATGAMSDARAEVMDRARGRCEYVIVQGHTRFGIPVDDRCTNPATQVHHRLRRSQGGTDTPDNLVALCATCHHERIHGHPEAAFAAGWLLHAPPLPEIRSTKDPR